jgi:hypothetical protein
VLQGVVLFLGSIIFLIVQRTELGGLPKAATFYRWAPPPSCTAAARPPAHLFLPGAVCRPAAAPAALTIPTPTLPPPRDPLKMTIPSVAAMQLVPKRATIVSYFDVSRPRSIGMGAGPGFSRAGAGRAAARSVFGSLHALNPPCRTLLSFSSCLPLPPPRPAPPHPYRPQFVIKTTIAATMFPHLSQRLFAGRNAAVVRRGLAIMGFTFFLVQLSSMLTGWCGSGFARH